MKKRILSFLLAVITVFTVIPWGVLPIFAEGEDTLVIGAIARFNTTDMVYMYADVTESGASSKTTRVYPSQMPETFVILDVITVSYGTEFYKIGTLDGSSHQILDVYPWTKSMLVEIVSYPSDAKPGITYNGQPVEEIPLYEDGKKALVATKPEGIEGAVTWGWEILVDAASDTWAKLYDKVTNVCDVTYALVINALDDNGRAKLRTVAYEGENTYRSDPITVQMKYAPKPMDSAYQNLSTVAEPATANENSGPAPLAATQSRKGGLMLLAEDTSTERITITVNFIKVRPDGTQVEAAYPDIRTLKTDYEGYTVTLPAVLGYYPSRTAPSNPYDFSQNPTKDTSLTSVTIDAGKTADDTINVYYYPGTASYTVYHYIKNVNNDDYTQYGSPISGSGTVDKAVPDCEISITGFHHLYYEHAEIAADGSTVIEIYYDREYFAVLFVFDEADDEDGKQDGAHNQENLYVQYGTVVGINDAECAGWTFNGWKVIEDEAGNYSDLAAGVTKQVEIVSAVTYKAQWSPQSNISYSVVYWLENANDGNYSVWYEEEKTSTSGYRVAWDGGVPQAVKDKVEYPYASLNSTKTNAEMYKDSADGVVVEGDGSTTVNVYFNRRVYNIDFLTTPTTNLAHNHNNTNDPCIYNTMYCSDPTHTAHAHTSACGAITKCTSIEHKHDKTCCDAHIHTIDCYDNVKPLSELGGALKDKIIDEKAAESWISKLASLLGINAKDWVAEQLDGSAGADIQKVTDSETQKIVTMEPPQNLKTGFIYANAVNVNFSYTYKNHWLLGGGTKTDTYNGEFSYTVIYIDNENDDTTDDWYYYSVPSGTVLKTGDFITSKCGKADHDHTSGCTYGKKCTKSEHVHINACYASCSDTTAQHTAACYGSVCMKPTTQTYTGKTGVADGTYTVISIQAKYGQDITDMLPYYLELSEYGLNKNASGDNFVGWVYAGTGWKQDETTQTTRYVKHVTMVDALCYSNGVTATAKYDASATTPYLLYYLFESFDQNSAAKPFDADGNGRQQLNTSWYDSDPVHMQLVMWNPNTAISQMDADGKEIEGMTYVGAKEGKNGTVTITVANAEVTATVNAYFYGRTTTKIILHNASQEILRIPVIGDTNLPKYGALLGDLAKYWKESALYNNFDVNNLPYPNTLEDNAYVFAGWYTTPYRNEYTKVDFESDTVLIDELNLYALWVPVTRYVEVYEDATMTTQFAADNHGEQAVGHRSYAVAPDYQLSTYYKNDYRFNGWFYLDANGNEQAFLFNFPVTQDMKIYAKWTSQQRVSYQVNYVTKVADANGNETYVKVANSLMGTAIAGQNKTFRALAGNSLYAEYQEGFFPQVGSHTIQMLYEKDAQGKVLVNEYNFIYDEVEMVNYWVKYIDAESGKSFDVPATYKGETRKAAVTELFVPVDGYSVDQYSKSLILSSQDQETNNVITFYYTKNKTEDPITAPWVVNHLIQNADGSYSIYSYSSGVGEVDDMCYGPVLTDIDGYTFSNKAEVETRYYDEVEQKVIAEVVPYEQLDSLFLNETQMYGYQLNEYGMEINLYYDRDNVGYKVQYKNFNTGELFYEYTVSKDQSVPHGHSVTVDLNQQKHMEIVLNKGCQLTDESTQRSLALYLDESRNVIIFYYQPFQSTFIYEIVCDDLSGSGVGLSMTRETIDAGSNGALTGSEPYESATYYFAGWYADEECTVPVVPGTHAVTLVDNVLTPVKTQFDYQDENGQTTSGNLYLGTTYYARFLPRSANLTVNVTSGQGDSFILTFTGKAGTFAEGKTFTVAVHDGVTTTVTDVPIGVYAVVSDAAWSWRYTQINTEVEVVVSVGGTLSLNATPNQDKWLTDDAHGVVTP